MTDNRTIEIDKLLDEFEHECLRKAYKRQREKTARAITATLGGTLTAEQVRKVLLYHLPHREYYSVEQTDAWQAIADELNAELGSGTCDATFDKDYYVGINGVCESLKCSSCGNPLSAKFRHCPWCGARIRKAVER